ncbi:MAG TPA: hypothetical protein GXX38_07480 [Clostridia bacterium]|nr:hypothetical protein [Clostridia bacterium]
MEQKNVGIVTLPGAASGDTPLSNFTKIVSQLSDTLKYSEDKKYNDRMYQFV